jgi:uncharacterized membrane protein YphA (DoxX/SURF4 family)
MNNMGAEKSRRWLDTGAVLARWVLGALFVYMGLKKGLNPRDFLVLVREYHLVSSPLLLNSIASTLPWFETFCGLLLIAGIAVRGTAIMLVTMLIPFTTIVLRRALEIASAQGGPFCMVKFDCGCGAGEVFICHKLWENTGLVLLAFWLIAGFGRKFSLRYSLFGEDSDYIAPAPKIESMSPTPLTSAASPVDSK